jgi:hypothetical protein
MGARRDDIMSSQRTQIAAWFKFELQIAHKPTLCDNRYVKDRAQGVDLWVHDAMIL